MAIQPGQEGMDFRRIVGFKHLLRKRYDVGQVASQYLALHSQQLRGMHGKLAQAEAQQQARE